MTATRFTFTVDRSRWARGGRGGPPALLNGNDAMCCLGFCAVAAGYNKGEIDGQVEPDDLVDDDRDSRWPIGLVEQHEEGLGLMYWGCTLLAADIMATNDNADIDDAEREERLRAAFAEIDVEIRFVGEGCPDGPSIDDIDEASP